MGKFFIIIIAICLISLSIITFVVFFYNPAQEEVKNDQSNNTLVDDSGKTASAFGVKMYEECLNEFNDFIKTYGKDYSKCLVNFDFNNEYCGEFDLETQALSDANVIVILDSSGSMADRIDSEVKIDVAKKAVSDFLTKMPQSVNTGLIVYGHKGSNSLDDKDLSCKGIEEVVKLGKNNSNNIISAMGSFNPKGWTPIAGSLDFVKNIFSSKGEKDKNYLILVSDGVETCDGDSLTVIKDLKLEIPDIKLSVIGFATDKETQASLKKIATLGGGSYLNADNSSGIAKAFNDQLLVIKKDCINVTLLELSLKYKTNNLNNLNCWLTAYKKESNDFTIIEQKSNNTECNIEMYQALIA
ncbi:MAG: VWA domain-containing protein, partial [Candidatus Staskawiczbacteria bacterium]|nr:VWA domain-containing protein [Candidatus Staskawiczbacteria bacterium]